MLEDEKNNPQLVALPMQVMSNGSKYFGQFNSGNGKREGVGCQIWLDGYRYEGWWSNGKINGRGRMISPEGNVYEGHYKNSKAQGQGTYRDANGS